MPETTERPTSGIQLTSKTPDNSSSGSKREDNKSNSHDTSNSVILGKAEMPAQQGILAKAGTLTAQRNWQQQGQEQQHLKPREHKTPKPAGAQETASPLAKFSQK
jgi:hypothetical protein